MTKASSTKKTERRKSKGLSQAQAQEGQARRRIEQYYEDKALEEALGLSLSDIHDTEPNAMPTYNITYFNAKQVKIDDESIFMKSLTNAKRSALHYAPDATCCIVIKDLMERTLSRYGANNGWTDSEA